MKVEFYPTETEKQLKIVRIPGSESFNRDRAIPYTIGFYTVSKNGQKHDQALTIEKIESCMSTMIIIEYEIWNSLKFEYLKSVKVNLNG